MILDFDGDDSLIFDFDGDDGLIVDFVGLDSLDNDSLDNIFLVGDDVEVFDDVDETEWRNDWFDENDDVNGRLDLNFDINSALDEKLSSDDGDIVGGLISGLEKPDSIRLTKFCGDEWSFDVKEAIVIVAGVIELFLRLCASGIFEVIFSHKL